MKRLWKVRGNDFDNEFNFKRWNLTANIFSPRNRTHIIQNKSPNTLPGVKRQLGELKQRYGNEKEALLTEIGDLKKETQELRASLATKEAEHEQW
jgi:hypothetical protein